jgi:hypothetical protein
VKALRPRIVPPLVAGVVVAVFGGCPQRSQPLEAPPGAVLAPPVPPRVVAPAVPVPAPGTVTPPRAAPASLVEAGRWVYVDEGCDNCHGAPDADIARALETLGRVPSPEALRNPIGPTPRSAGWRARHLMDPRSVSPRSIMPPFAHLAASSPETPWRDTIENPSSPRDEWISTYATAAREVAVRIATDGPEVSWDSSLVALVAWLDALPTDDR